MLEIPEANHQANQLDRIIKHKTIQEVLVAHSPHKFAFFHEDPNDYPTMLFHKKITGASAYGGLIEIEAQDIRIVFGDSVNIRYIGHDQKKPEKHQLLLGFTDGSALVCFVSMYGGLWVFKEGSMKNHYYAIAKEKPSVLSDAFDWNYFWMMLENQKPTLSIKAVLATEQRIPGFGNGVLQDVLYHAGMHPKTKLNEISDQQRLKLYAVIKETIKEMTDAGGRSTEKDIFGQQGGYPVIMAKHNLFKPCPTCNTLIVKEAYMGGNVYFCPTCQPLHR